MMIEKLNPTEWASMSEDAHVLCFSEKRPASKDRIDYVLLGTRNSLPVGYITAKEFDSETVYWQFGGMFPVHQKSPFAIEAFSAAINWEKENHKRICCFIENDNPGMLKMAMKFGFVIQGIKTFNGNTLVEFMLELSK